MRMVKRLLFALGVIVLIFMTLISVAFAADSSPGDTVTPTEYLSWEFLGTMGGAMLATTLVVQFLKVPIDKVWKIRTRYIVYVIALAILLSVEYVTQGGILIDRALLIILNAFVVALASMQAYESTFAKIEGKATTISARDKPG
jgi:lipid-A-disaccharide synthase-like uncharacterized protein